jgi:hypothetical protein
MAKIPLFIKGQNGKSCEGCTKCCEGYLTAEVNGVQIGGDGCSLVVKGVGCSVYETRPQDPCRSFECFWKASNIMPMEFKPSEVGVIISTPQIDGIPYLHLVEAGNKVPAEVLSWFLEWVFKNQLNAEWQIGDTWHVFGSRDFLKAIDRRNMRKR